LGIARQQLDLPDPVTQFCGEALPANSIFAFLHAAREYFPESRIAEEDYASLVASMPGADPDDRHHKAAAISGRARMLVTWNLRDFPAEPLAALGLRVVDPDRYLCQLLDRFPQEVTATVVRLAGEKRRPPKTGSTADAVGGWRP